MSEKLDKTTITKMDSNVSVSNSDKTINSPAVSFSAKLKERIGWFFLDKRYVIVPLLRSVFSFEIKLIKRTCSPTFPFNIVAFRKVDGSLGSPTRSDIKQRTSGYSIKTSDLISRLSTVSAFLFGLKNLIPEEILVLGGKGNNAYSASVAGNKYGVSFLPRRWIGGLLTNYSVIQPRIQRLLQMKKIYIDDWPRSSIDNILNLSDVCSDLNKVQKHCKVNTFTLLKKSEYRLKSPEFSNWELRRIAINIDNYSIQMKRDIFSEYLILMKKFSGLRHYPKKFKVVIILDSLTKSAQAAIAEAKLAGIPIIAFLSPQSNSADIDYPIWINTLSPKAIMLVVALILESFTVCKNSIACKLPLVSSNPFIKHKFLFSDDLVAFFSDVTTNLICREKIMSQY